MSQENSESSDGMSQESVQEMVRQMTEKEMKGWQKEKIEEKFRLVMLHYNLDVEISAAEEKNKKMDESIKKSLESLQAKENILLKCQQRKKEMKETQGKAFAFRKDLTNRVEAIEAMQRLQICPQLDYHFKAVTNLTNRIKELNLAKKVCNKKYEEEKANMILYRGAIQAEKEYLDEEESRLQQKLDEADAALKNEREKTTDIQKKIRRSQKLMEEIEEVDEETKKLEGLLDGENQKLIQAQDFVNEVQREISYVEQQIEETKSNEVIIAAEAEAFEKQLEDFTLLTVKIQSKSFEELETDEIFQREVMNEPFYMESKQKSNLLMLENIQLDKDLAGIIEYKEQLKTKLKELQKEHLETDEVIDKLQLEVRAKQKEVEKKDAIRAAEKAKALELQAECLKEEEEVEKLRNKFSTAVEELNMKLELEKEKTKKVREERKRVYSKPVPEMSSAFQNAQENMPLRSMLTPSVSSSFSSLLSIPVYKTDVENPLEDDRENAFSDSESSFNITFNTDIEEFLDDN